MKYRLKDLAFQRQLDGITSNKFTMSLLSGIDPADYCRVFEVVGGSARLLDGASQGRHRQAKVHPEVDTADFRQRQGLLTISAIFCTYGTVPLLESP